MPDEFPVDRLVDHLIIMDAVLQGREQYRQGKYFTQDEVEQQLSKWPQRGK